MVESTHIGLYVEFPGKKEDSTAQLLAIDPGGWALVREVQEDGSGREDLYRAEVVSLVDE